MTLSEYGVILAFVCAALMLGWTLGWKGGYEAGLMEDEERRADLDEARIAEAERDL